MQPIIRRTITITITETWTITWEDGYETSWQATREVDWPAASCPDESLATLIDAAGDDQRLRACDDDAEQTAPEA